MGDSLSQAIESKLAERFGFKTLIGGDYKAWNLGTLSMVTLLFEEDVNFKMNIKITVYLLFITMFRCKSIFRLLRKGTHMLHDITYDMYVNLQCSART